MINRGTSMAEYCEKLELSDDLAIGAAVGECSFGLCPPQV